MQTNTFEAAEYSSFLGVRDEKARRSCRASSICHGQDLRRDSGAGLPVAALERMQSHRRKFVRALFPSRSAVSRCKDSRLINSQPFLCRRLPVPPFFPREGGVLKANSASPAVTRRRTAKGIISLMELRSPGNYFQSTGEWARLHFQIA